jgi:hypothetical protein
MKTAILSPPSFYYDISSGINNLRKVSHRLSPEELTECYNNNIVKSLNIGALITEGKGTGRLEN